jgi:hypothetical protein
MKLKAIGCMLALSVGLSGVALAAGSYYPPERLHCQVSEAGKLACADFNREYLTEATYTANFEPGKEVIFIFASGSAFAAGDEWSVFYTYKDMYGKNIRLKSANTSIHPDFDAGEWNKMKNYFVCTAGYMSCPIVGL